MRLREKVASQFEENLDIRGFVQLQKDFSLLMSFFFSKEQALLFKHQSSQSITLRDKEETHAEKGQSPRQELAKLLNYRISSRLDRQLLEGVLMDSDEIADPKTHDFSNIPLRSHRNNVNARLALPSV